MKGAAFLFLALLFNLNVSAAAQQSAAGRKLYTNPLPEQIHLAYGDTDDSMVVSWSTSASDASYVKWGKVSAKGFTNTAQGESEHFRPSPCQTNS